MWPGIEGDGIAVWVPGQLSTFCSLLLRKPGCISLPGLGRDLCILIINSFFSLGELEWFRCRDCFVAIKTNSGLNT